MHQLILFLGLIAFVASQEIVLTAPQGGDLAAPTPYQFSYSAPADGGGSTHEQTGDGFGRVTGTYTIQDEDGRQRVVNYVADEGGFRASISTNEPGTSNQNPADVTIESSADDGTQRLTAPVPTVIPVSPVAPAAIAPAPRITNTRPTLIPIQPAVVPFQPAVIPFQPATTFGGFIPIQGAGNVFQPFNPFGNSFILPATA